MNLLDTVVAEATAPFEAALSIVRLSGIMTGEILSKVTNKKTETLVPRRLYQGPLYGLDGRLIDEATFIYFKSGHSYTGEEAAEFYVHGSRIIVEELLETIIACGARRAEGGEFTAKAYFNGKLSLLKAEAVNEIIKAKTARGKTLALKTLTGENSGRLTRIRENLLNLMAEIEVDIDYPEYEESQNLALRLREELPRLNREATSLCSDSRSELYALTGVRIAIVGRPNVGKSTLLNALLGYDKAIVTAIPGTTRDVVEGEKNVNGIIYRFFDTAGIRDNPDPIEKLGIAKSFDTIDAADLILYVFDEWSEEEFREFGLTKNPKPLLKVQNKIDCRSPDRHADISLSARSQDVSGLFPLIDERLDITALSEGGFVSKRDLDLLSTFTEELNRAVLDLEEGQTVDVIETRLLRATHILGELTGHEQTMEDLYATVFSRFCVGK